MAISKMLLCTGLLLTSHAFALKIDKKEIIKGVQVQTGKEKGLRTYQGSITKTFAYPIDEVKKGITNFSEKCNNSYKDRRKFTDKTFQCKHHNENLIETFVIRDIPQSEEDKKAGEVEKFVLGRRIYNRGDFNHYELVQVIEGKNELNQKTLKIVQRMLTDGEVKNYTKPKFERESAFVKMISTYTLTEVSPTQTTLNYDYDSKTEHWLLNKEISVPQVFATISKSINVFMKTIETELVIQRRNLASAHTSL
jgi:hypothetical protein